MSHEARLVVEEGPGKGKEFVVPAGGGVRAGRSASNEIALNDPSVSRFHCRIFFKPGQGLWVTDLGSANHTLVNGKAVQEQQVRVRDRIAIGDTVVKVAADGTDSVPADSAPVKESAPAVPAVSAAPAVPADDKGVDLGLASTAERARSPKANLRMLLLLVALVAMAGLVVWVFLYRIPSGGNGGSLVPPMPVSKVFELTYEKVEGSASNIFQYVLVIADNKATLQLHDLANGRHLVREPIEVASNTAAALAKMIEDAGFFTLEPAYASRDPSAYNLRSLTVTVGLRTHRTKVVNAVEPPAFENARKAIEDFGLNEFGIAGWPYSRDDLIKMAREAVDLGLKLYDEKKVREDNLFRAIRSLKEAGYYLETLDPKPDFYQETVAMQARCEKELEDICKDLWFMAERGIKLRDWQEAANYLQQICTAVPDRANKNHQRASERLLEVQRRLGPNSR